MALLPPVYAELRASTSDFQAKMGAAKATMTDLAGGASSLGSKITSFAQKVTEFAAAGAAAVAVVSVKLAGDFQSATEHLVTDAGESQQAIGLITKGILDMAGKVGQTPQQLANALYSIESSGFHAAAGLTILQAAAEGAAAGGTDTQTVVSALAPALHDYGLSASSAVSVTNQLIAAVSQGNIHLSDLASALATVLPAASAAHVSLAQVLGAVSTLTVAGQSAQESTLMVADTIKGISQPSNVARQALEQMGVSSVNLSQNLGKAGLTGSIDTVVEAILQHMGPSGLVLEGAFNKSKLAASDLQTMLASMSPSVRALALQFESGKLTMSQFRKEIPTSDYGMISQFEALYNTVNGFSTSLKNGSAASTTFLGELSKVFGNAIVARSALELSGASADYFAGAVKHVTAAAGDTKTVQGFAEISKTFNFQLQQVKATAEALAVRLGDYLIPKIQELGRWLQSGITWLDKHRGAAADLAKVVGGVLATAVGITAVNALVKFEHAGASALRTVTSLVLKIHNLGQASKDSTGPTAGLAGATGKQGEAAGPAATNTGNLAGAEQRQGANAATAEGPTTTLGGEMATEGEEAGAAAGETNALADAEVRLRDTGGATLVPVGGKPTGEPKPTVNPLSEEEAVGGGLGAGQLLKKLPGLATRFAVGVAEGVIATAAAHKLTEHWKASSDVADKTLQKLSTEGGLPGLVGKASKVPVFGSSVKFAADLGVGGVDWYRHVFEHQGSTITGTAPGVGKIVASAGPTRAQLDEAQKEQENRLLYLTPGMGQKPGTIGPVTGTQLETGPNTITGVEPGLGRVVASRGPIASSVVTTPVTNHVTVTVNVDARGATASDATVIAMKTAEAVRVAGLRRARSTGNLLSTRAGTNVGSQR